MIDIILSLTRTLRPGYIRDLRRLTVALSRARLGFYVLGRKSVFDSVYELRPAFEKLFERPTQLELVTGEMYGAVTRQVDEECASTTMVSVEHLGQYVFEMTGARVKMLKEGAMRMPAIEEARVVDGVDSEDEEVVGEDSDVDVDDDEEVAE